MLGGACPGTDQKMAAELRFDVAQAGIFMTFLTDLAVIGKECKSHGSRHEKHDWTYSHSQDACQRKNGNHCDDCGGRIFYDLHKMTLEKSMG